MQLAETGVHQVAGHEDPAVGAEPESVVVLGAVGTSSEPGSWARPPMSTVVADGAFQSRWVARLGEVGVGQRVDREPVGRQQRVDVEVDDRAR